MTSPDPIQPLPYATGVHYAAKKSPDEAYRDGDTLIVLHGTTLPNRCVLCGNEGTPPPIRLVFTWDASFHMTRQSTLELRKKVVMHAHLCATHRQRWKSARQLGGAGAGSSLILMLVGMTTVAVSENSTFPEYTSTGIILTLFGFACLTLSLFYFTLRSRTLSCKNISEGYIYLDGAAPEFLATLPPVPAQQMRQS